MGVKYKVSLFLRHGRVEQMLIGVHLKMQNTMTITDIRQRNKLKVLRFVIEKEETTMPEIGKALGISRPTVSTLVDELIKDNYIKILGIGHSTDQGGKRPQLLSFYPRGRGIISVHVGVQLIDVALIDLQANVLFRIREKTKPYDGKDKIVGFIKESISELFKKANTENIPVLGIGVGCLGLVETSTGKIINSVHFQEMNGLNLGELLSERFCTPVVIDNECHNLALAEKLFGAGKKNRTFISLVTDVGIGAGIIINNQIYRGIDNSFGEIGHTIVNFEGPSCHCGNNGCWELYASSNALLNRAFQEYEHTTALKSIVSNPGHIEVCDIVKALELGDEVVRSFAIKELGKYIGLGISNTVNTFNPELVIIHGEMTELGHELKSEIEKWVKEKALPTPAGRVRIIFSDLGANANIIGGGALVISELFEKPEYLFNLESV